MLVSLCQHGTIRFDKYGNTPYCQLGNARIVIGQVKVRLRSTHFCLYEYATFVKPDSRRSFDCSAYGSIRRWSSCGRACTDRVTKTTRQRPVQAKFHYCPSRPHDDWCIQHGKLNSCFFQKSKHVCNGTHTAPWPEPENINKTNRHQGWSSRTIEEGRNLVAQLRRKTTPAHGGEKSCMPHPSPELPIRRPADTDMHEYAAAE